MKLRMLLAMLTLMVSVGFAQKEEGAKDASFGTVPAGAAQGWFPGLRGGPLYDNGPLVNSPGTGVGGADESVLQSVSLGMNTLGAGHQVLNGNRVADDFTIPPGESWNIERITFFAYQTGSTTTSTMTGVNFQIWDGPPGVGGSSVVFGDTTTNRMTNTSWSGILRVTETTTGVANDRPIMANECDIAVVLDAGTYWIDWQTDGSLGSGPWAPPITINGQAVTGNSQQSLAGGAFAPLLDTGTGTPAQGLPFIIDGTPACSITDITLAGSSAVTITGDCTSGVDLYCQGPNGLTLIQAGVVVNGSVTVNVGFNPDSFYFVAAPGDTTPINGLTTGQTVPTLQTWALIVFIALLSIVAMVFLRRNRLAAQQ